MGARYHTFDEASAGRIGDAVRWVEEFILEEGVDLDNGTDDGATLGNIEDQGETSNQNTFALLVNIAEWDVGTTQTFTNSYDVTRQVTNTTTDAEGNQVTETTEETETITETITASNPFADAAGGKGVIVNCGVGGWVLVAATCKEDADEEDSNGRA